MAVWFVTGKLGGGKTLGAVHRVQKYLNQGRTVATNLDLFLEHMINPDSKACKVFRIPDKPSPDDFDALPLGYEGEYQGEHKNGLIVLDECGTWFNARNWNDKGRAEIINWVIHARKKRWDLIFIVQDISVVDKQAREMFAEHVVYCRRTDRFNIPFVGFIFKMFFGETLPIPKYHIGFVHYGDSPNSPLVDRWGYRGESLYAAYNTEQVFLPFTSTNSACAFHTVLPPWYVYGRYFSPMERFKNALKGFEVKGRHFFLIGAALAALGTNAAVTALPETPKKGIFGCNDAYRHLYGSCDAYPIKPEDKPNRGSDTAKPEAEDPSKPNPLDGAYISGSLQTDHKFDYVFHSSDGRTWYPAADGYRVSQHSRCLAVLTDFQGVAHQIRCHPSDPDYSG